MADILQAFIQMLQRKNGFCRPDHSGFIIGPQGCMVRLSTKINMETRRSPMGCGNPQRGWLAENRTIRRFINRLKSMHPGIRLFLVRNKYQTERPCSRNDFRRQGNGRGTHGGYAALHITASTPVNPAVFLSGHEGGMRPGAFRRNHIQMTAEFQDRPPGSDRADKVRPVITKVLYIGFQAVGGKDLPQKFSCRFLISGRVNGVDAHQPAEDVKRQFMTAHSVLSFLRSVSGSTYDLSLS